ncbi:hypothetical protein B484DRAFT_409722 [Ochromonadaceae sp. CCMP2298]|nr:hypothetical protein B484DRAFT_409722 [Ochromonadaceae sp. CCMP2298]
MCVYEQRLSNLCQSLLCALVCIRPFSELLREIPKAVLYGIFIFLGATSFEDNEFSYRMNMLVMDPQLRKTAPHPPSYQFVSLPFAVIRRYTVIQMTLVAVIFGVTFTPAGVIFPVLIAGLVCVR